jgi:hypothetical protein
MYIRFVIHKVDDRSGKRQGLFQAMSDLVDAYALNEYEELEYAEIYEWFRENLKKPRSFSRSTEPDAPKVALSWFRHTATEHVSRMYRICQILADHGILVEVLRTERPGLIVYEDEFQVTAEPLRDTVT